MGVVFTVVIIIVIAVWVTCILRPHCTTGICSNPGRLGAYQATWSTEFFRVPFIERVAEGKSMKEQVVDFPPQPVITKDNVTMQIDTVVFFQIHRSKLYTYGVESDHGNRESVPPTTLRNIIGDMELDGNTDIRGDH